LKAAKLFFACIAADADIKEEDGEVGEAAAASAAADAASLLLGALVRRTAGGRAAIPMPPLAAVAVVVGEGALTTARLVEVEVEVMVSLEGFLGCADTCLFLDGEGDDC
jgi:hypothetical protein